VHLNQDRTFEGRSLPAIEGYRLWAPTYSDETAISFLENKLVGEMAPSLEGKRLLDAGCGTGRRLKGSGAREATGLDQSEEMLAACGDLPRVELVHGDLRSLPFGERSFDVIWCRLVIGHLARIDRAYAEMARVADDGAIVIVSDFHPAAVEAGHRRTFRNGTDVIELEHWVHGHAKHIEAAEAADLTLLDIREAKIGDEVRPFYRAAGRLSSYARDIGLPVVLALSFRKTH
jgi:malonyl-CoA O-methyltransferase